MTQKDIDLLVETLKDLKTKNAELSQNLASLQKDYHELVKSLTSTQSNNSTAAQQSQSDNKITKFSDIPQPRVSRVKEILAGGASKAQESKRDLQEFTLNDSVKIRALLIGDEPYFIAMDIAKALDYRDAEVMTRRLDEDELTKIASTNLVGANFSNMAREITLINESGLYSAILGSNKPEAKTFKRWVTKEVLPSIRKTGTYQIDSQTQKEVFNLIYETPCREAVLRAVKNIEKDKKAKVHSIKEYTITEKFKGNKAITNCEIGVQWDTPPLLNAKNAIEIQALNQRKRKYK